MKKGKNEFERKFEEGWFDAGFPKGGEAEEHLKKFGVEGISYLALKNNDKIDFLKEEIVRLRNEVKDLRGK